MHRMRSPHNTYISNACVHQENVCVAAPSPAHAVGCSRQRSIPRASSICIDFAMAERRGVCTIVIVELSCTRKSFTIIYDLYGFIMCTGGRNAFRLCVSTLPPLRFSFGIHARKSTKLRLSVCRNTIGIAYR